VSEQDRFGELISRVRNRDEDAARELATRYESAIRRAVRIHLRDPRMRQVLDSMDVCQSVLASFFVRTALGQYDLTSPEQLLHLLTTMTRNKLANQFQRTQAQRRDVRRQTSYEDHELAIVDRASDPGEQVAAKEILAQVCARLNEQERYLANQRSLGRSWQELAEELGATHVALRKKLSRALNRVMGELGLEDHAYN
jgi:RNA polymerase sigma-70 factor (ECF subfamily)